MILTFTLKAGKKCPWSGCYNDNLWLYQTQLYDYKTLIQYLVWCLRHSKTFRFVGYRISCCTVELMLLLHNQFCWHLFSEKKYKVHHIQLIKNLKVKKTNMSTMNRSCLDSVLCCTSELIYTDNPEQLALTGASKRQWHSQATDTFPTQHLTLSLINCRAPQISAWLAASTKERLQTQLTCHSWTGLCEGTEQATGAEGCCKGSTKKDRGLHKVCTAPLTSVTHIECCGWLHTWEQNLAVPVWSLPKI